MAPKKAIIIVFILFLAIALIFVFLYLNKQLAENGDNNLPTGAKQGQPTTSEQNQQAIQAELKELDRLRSQSRSAANSQESNIAEDLQLLDKLRQDAGTATSSVQDAQTEFKELDKLRAQSQTPAP